MAEINPESLSAATPADSLFTYLDLSSVDNGRIDRNMLRTEVFRTAPSRARRAVRPGDVLFGTVRPALRSHGAVDWQPDLPLVASTGFCVIRARPSQSTPRFLFHTILSDGIAGAARQREVGSNYPAVNECDVRRFPVLCPPVVEQRRIAAILDTLDDAIRKTEDIVVRLKLVKLGLAHDLLTRGIGENGELRPAQEEAHDLYTNTRLGIIPKAWHVVRMSHAVPKAEYGISSPLGESGDIAILRMNNLRGGELVLADLKYSGAREARALLLRRGDVLFNRTNSLDHVGRTAIWRDQLEMASFASYLVRLLTNPAVLTDAYLHRWLNLPAVQSRIRRFATPGVHQVNINPTNLRQLDLALPKSTQEQDRITHVLDVWDGRVGAEEALLRKLRSIKCALADDLLAGRISVAVPGVAET